MKVGDKLLCKRDKWGVIDWDSNGGIEKWGDIILKGKYYVVDGEVIKLDLYKSHWSITSELEVIPTQIYSYYAIDKYFYTKKEIRKMKLDKIL